MTDKKKIEENREDKEVFSSFKIGRDRVFALVMETVPQVSLGFEGAIAAKTATTLTLRLTALLNKAKSITAISGIIK